MLVPHERYQEDVMGMPCYAAAEKLIINLSHESMVGAVPQDDENCAIALGCKTQLHSPYVSVGRTRTDVALPHPKGVVKPGYGDTHWAVVRFKNNSKVREIIIAADTGTLGDEGALVELIPPTTTLPERKKKSNGLRKKGGTKRGTDSLTEMGVRILTGQRRRS